MRVSELSGAKLDYWVAKAEGVHIVMRHGHACKEEDFDPEIHCHESSLKEWKCWTRYSYSTDWRNAGPIIERERIGLDTWQREWAAQFTFPVAHPTNPRRDPSHHRMNGATPLIAAMRTFVASKYGDEVPEE